MNLVPLQLYSRAGCTLCHRAQQALDLLEFEYEVLDLDQHPELLAQWRTEIPVLVRRDTGEVLLRGALSRSRLSALKLRLLKEVRAAEAGGAVT